MNKKRTRLEVVRDILEVIRNKNGKIKPTHILYKSNLSYQMMDQYLKELMGKGFIVEQKKDRGKTYSITDKGLQYLSQYHMIADFTSSFGLGEEGI
jgi:predicted transcriptional regulator